MPEPVDTTRLGATQRGRRSSRLFDGWAGTYDNKRLQADTYRPVHDKILARLADRPDGGWSTIIDLGCGTGQLTGRLADAHPEARVIGLDYSNGMLDRAAKRMAGADTGSGQGAQVRLVRADAQRPPIRSGAADAVVCTESFHWYPDQPAALEAVADILEPGGLLLIASIATVTGPGRQVLQLASSMAGQPIRALPPSELAALLERSAFEVVGQRRIRRPGFVPWPVLTEAVRNG